MNRRMWGIQAAGITAAPAAVDTSEAETAETYQVYDRSLRRWHLHAGPGRIIETRTEPGPYPDIEKRSA